MNIPLNGRIAIVDDKYAEVKPLMDIFSKKRIPFNYYTGLKSSELPLDSTINPISLFFLDLNIVESQHTSRAVISTLHPILKAICPEKSIPYFLVIWSKKINDFADDLEKHFLANKDLKKRKPVKIIRLSKNDYFNLEDGKFIFDQTKYELLVQTLTIELENVAVLKNFLIWENIVHSKTINTTAEFSSFYPIDNHWDKNTKAIIFHLAKALIGNDDVLHKSDSEKLLAAFVNINSFLANEIQNAIEIDKLGVIENVIDEKYDAKKNDGLRPSIKAELNTKLHFDIKNFELLEFQQGNIYKMIEKAGEIRKNILWKKESIAVIKSRPPLLQLDITPVCDYSQDKKYSRMVYGLLIDVKYHDKVPKGTFVFKTPIFQLEGKQKFILFDFRFIVTTSKKELTKRKIRPFLRLRKEICTDIQSQLSNQVNRPGISSI